MVLKSVNISKLGPFLTPLTIPLDARVTVLTGANDVGKSSVLRALQLAFTNDAATQDDINFDHVQSARDWTKDPKIAVEVVVSIDRPGDFDGHARTGASTLRKCLAPEATTLKFMTGVSGVSQDMAFRMPAVIRPLLNSGIRDIIDLRQPEPLELALLSAAIERRFDFGSLEPMSDLHFSRAIHNISTNLNRLLERVLPAPGTIKFDLVSIAGDRTRLGIMLRDRHDGITPFGQRGQGVRKMITLLSELITTAGDAHHRLILLDEPENSLHADAQHLLREFLWDITAKPGVQVVYATHSPAMLSPMRPEQIRLLVREKHNDSATTKLAKNPAGDNLGGLRTSLGVSIADSLLYAPVTVITEGDTEVSCLRPLVDKLASAGIAGFGEATKLLGLAHFSTETVNRSQFSRDLRSRTAPKSLSF